MLLCSKLIAGKLKQIAKKLFTQRINNTNMDFANQFRVNLYITYRPIEKTVKSLCKSKLNFNNASDSMPFLFRYKLLSFLSNAILYDS